MDVISLFAGAGGMDLGFIQAGYRILWANDIWDEAVETYRFNLGNHIYCGDISTLDADVVPNADILVGGFPCQGFSVANRKRHTGDERNRLYLELLRILMAKKPRFFLAENVKGILSIGKGEVFRLILRDFEGAGYEVQHAVLNAADYGVPQRRERVFFFGKRKDIGGQFQFPPKPTHGPKELCALTGLKPWVSIGQALAGLPDPTQMHDLHNHEFTKYKLRFNGFLGHRVMNPDLPSPTITARGDDRGGVVIHHHPNNERRLSAREVATIQTFPENFFFHGPKTSAYRQIANAVPPKLAYTIATWLAEAASTD